MVCEYEAGSVKSTGHLWPFAEADVSDSEGKVIEWTWMGRYNLVENIPFYI